MRPSRNSTQVLRLGSEEPLKEDRHQRNTDHHHGGPKSPLDKDFVRLERHPSDGSAMNAGPKKHGGGGCGWGKLGEEVGGLDAIHNAADLEYEEEALWAEGASREMGDGGRPRQAFTLAHFMMAPAAKKVY